MEADYFERRDVVDAMEHDHLLIWREILRVIGHLLSPGCRVLDFGCNSGALLRLLFLGAPGILPAFNPSLAVGVEPVAMARVLLEASERTPRDLPILYTHAPLNAFRQQFDLILSHEVLYLLDDLQETLAAAHAALKPGGVFCAATMGYTENPYYRRWLNGVMRDRRVGAQRYSRDDYVDALRHAGFVSIETRPIALSAASYAAWRSERPFDDLEWFSSEEDERHYFVDVGKLAFVARAASR